MIAGSFRHPFVDATEPGEVGQRAVGEHHAGDVDGDEPASLEGRRRPESEVGDGEGEDRVEPRGGEADLAEEPAAAPADGEPGGDAHRELDHGPGHDPPAVQLAGDEGQRHGEREDDRHRVVHARLDLEQVLEPRPDPDPRAPQDGEDGRRVRGGDDGAEEERLGPAEAERARSEREHPRRARDAQRGEEPRRRDDTPDARHRGVEPAVEEDEDEGDRAGAEGEPVVLEGDPADALRPGEHADEEEEEDDRDPEPSGGPRGEDGHREEHPHDDQGDRSRQGFGRHARAD